MACFFLSTFTLVIVLVVGCANPRKPYDQVQGGVASTPGDGEIAPPETSLVPPASAPIFPHSKEWAGPASHGVWVVQNNIDVCLKCHQSGITAAKAAGRGGAPTCSSCHVLFPHPQSWVKKENHGAHVMAKGKGACGTQCHGFDFKGGLSKIACNTCHSIYPHLPGWVSPAEHGEKARGDKKSLCSGCHGGDLKGGTSRVGCYQSQCHNNVYPHEAGWKIKEKHGKFVMEYGRGNCTTQCHGVDLKGGLSAVACNACHNSLYPHAASWVQDHGSAAKTSQNEACQICHGADYKKELDGQNCFSCHEDYPHAAPEVWTPFSKGHGERVQLTRAKKTETCEACHGADLKTKKQWKQGEPQNCFSCHITYPHTKFSATEWKNYEGHGKSILDEGTDKTECFMCHGSSDLTGGPRGQNFCFECHASYPHLPADWRTPQGHGAYVNARGSTSCATARCHGENLVADQRSRGPSCSGCHKPYPHPENWRQSHGTTTATLGLPACKSCHGENFDRVMSNSTTCFTCHPDYPHTAEGWVRPSGQPQVHAENIRNAASTARCEKCHGTDLTKMKQEKNCFTCHDSYPHKKKSVAWGQYDGHGDYLLGAEEHNLSDCQKCHGQNYQGGSGGQPSCFSCHASYPHSLLPSIGSIWSTLNGHGKYVTGKVTETAPTKKIVEECQMCHGADYTGGSHNQPSCTQSQCHIYPHADPQWVQEPRASPQKHGVDIAAGTIHIDSCAKTVCHRAPPAGTVSVPPTTNGPLCSSCHNGLYPHPVDWAGIQRHGAVATGNAKRNCASANCHGVNFVGGAAKSCLDCHVFPHPASTTTMVWKTLTQQTTSAGLRDNSFHGDAFIRKEQESRRSGQANTACGSVGACHGPGPSYNRTALTINCEVCHRRNTGGISHQDIEPFFWENGGAHGTYFAVSKRWTSDTADASCWKCHGGPITFPAGFVIPPLWAQSQNRQSDCYACHSYYPHKERYAGTGGVALRWRSSHTAVVADFFSNPDLTPRYCGGSTNGSCHNNPPAQRRPSRRLYYEPSMEACFYCHDRR